MNIGKCDYIGLNRQRLIEMAIKKGTLVVLNSRINHMGDIDWSLHAVNSSFLLEQMDNNDLDDIFSEDYSEFLYLNRKEMESRICTIEIYFKRKEFKALIEKWSFAYAYPQYVNNLLIDLLLFLIRQCIESTSDCSYCYKNLVMLLKSVYVLSRLMPAYHLKNQKSTGTGNENDDAGILEYRLFAKMENQNQFDIEHISKVNIANSPILNLSVQLEYISIENMTLLENNFNKKIISPSKDGQEPSKPFSVNEEHNDIITIGGIIQNAIDSNIIQDYNENDNEEVIEDILFLSDNDNENNNDKHEQAKKEIEVDITSSKCFQPIVESNMTNESNKAVFQSFSFPFDNTSLVTDTMKGFKQMKEKAFKNIAKTTNKVKAMKTSFNSSSSSSSSFISNESFQLDFDEMEMSNNSSLMNSDVILNKLNSLKRLFNKNTLKHKMRFFIPRLALIYLTMLTNKY